MQDETEVDVIEKDFLRFYFVRERVITERIFGGEWRRHLKNPQWQSRRDQVSNSRCSSECWLFLTNFFHVGRKKIRGIVRNES